MSASTVALALALGFLAGTLAGLFGVGGGILFVPTLVLLGLGQLEAGATSLLAIVPTAAVAAARQRGRGTLDLRAALVVGVASFAGIEVGIQIASRLDEDVLRRLFGVLLVAVSAQLAIRCLRADRRYPGAT
jgi:uncharacterized membrane protein YfcA